MRRRRVAAVVAAVLLVVGACSDDDGSAAEQPTRYVALGDSFSSGEGARDYDPGSGRCHRSERSWPQVFDARDTSVVLVEVRACGGADIDRLLGPWPQREQPAQIPDVPDPTVGLVTFTIGGNDIGFGELVLRCLLGDCSGVPESTELEDRLAAVAVRLADEVVPALRRAYPAAVLVQVGYPRLTPEAGPLVGCGWLRESERAATVAIVDRLNDTISRASEADFVDVSDALAGHELCTDDPWVNEIISLDSERAHPTADGYLAIGRAVAHALEGAVDDRGNAGS